MELCGVYLNRGRFIMTCAFVPISITLMQSKSILLYFKQDQKVAEYASTYIMCYLPGLYILGLNDCQRRFLNSLGKNSVPLISQIVAIAFHLLWSYLFVDKLGYGI
jgi:Na+-driven multidrug efflux pump